MASTKQNKFVDELINVAKRRVCLDGQSIRLSLAFGMSKECRISILMFPKSKDLQLRDYLYIMPDDGVSDRKRVSKFLKKYSIKGRVWIVGPDRIHSQWD